MERLNSIGEVLKGFTLEIKYLLYIMFLYLNIDIDVFKILILFMALDTTVGVVKVIRIDYKSFSFSKLLWGLVSKLGILIIPLVVALLSKGVGQDMTMGVMLIVKILIVSEFISTISNLYTIKTKVVVKDIDIFTMIFKFLRNSAYELLKKYTSLDPNDFHKSNKNKKDELQ